MYVYLVADFTNHFLLCIAPFLDAFPVGKLYIEQEAATNNQN